MLCHEARQHLIDRIWFAAWQREIGKVLQLHPLVKVTAATFTLKQI